MRLSFSNKQSIFVIQLVGWAVIVGTSLFWSIDLETRILDVFGFLMFGINLVLLLLIYMLNYSIFIPRFLFRDNRKLFFMANIILIVVLLVCSYFFNDRELLGIPRPVDAPHERPRANLMFLARDMVSYILMIGLVTALRLAERLQKSEEALKEAEAAMIKAELANLRSQINPHFLLNTLNNIYVLTAIDTDKAQKTIVELSNLLRYILYGNMSDKVLLVREIAFIKTYIELMSIRLPRRVKLTTEFILDPESTTTIAPLIFISLIENAFKHSINSNGEGYIDIFFEDQKDSGKVILNIKNSNSAKKDEDKSGHGIGLEQVKRRLELLYANNYSWKIKVSEEEYCSILTLNKI